MCFGSPDPPPTTDQAADPELARQRIQLELDQAAIKAENKKRRTEEQLALLMGKIGRASLFSGGAGGMGFGTQGIMSLVVGSGGGGPGASSNSFAYAPGAHYSFYDIAAPVSGGTGGGDGGGVGSGDGGTGPEPPGPGTGGTGVGDGGTPGYGYGPGVGDNGSGYGGLGAGGIVGGYPGNPYGGLTGVGLFDDGPIPGTVPV